MKLNIEQLKLIREELDVLKKFGIDFYDDSGFITGVEDDELPEEMEIDEISLEFPDDQDYSVYSIEDFMDYMSEISSLKRVDLKTVKTKHVLQTVISSSRMGYYAFEDKLGSFSFKGDGIDVDIVERPFLIGVKNAIDNHHDDTFLSGACEPYWAIEIRSKDVIDTKQAEDLVERICFYLTLKLGVEVYPSEIVDFEELYDRVNEFFDGEEDKEDNEVISISDLPSYSPLHKMYRQAKGIEDPQIQYLQYYKIVEHVSKMVASKVAYDSLKNELKNLQAIEGDSKQLDPIMEILRKYDTSIKDETIAASVIESCIDVEQLFDLLPERIKSIIEKNFKANKKPVAEDGFSEEQKSVLCKQIGSIMYATRNRIVHAKSNYTAKDNELNDDELPEANEMMDVFVKAILKWNKTQPEGFRV